MTKHNKMLYLESDLLEQISCPLSPLVNKLLDDYIKNANMDEMTLEQLRAEREILAMEREHQLKIKEVRENARVR